VNVMCPRVRAAVACASALLFAGCNATGTPIAPAARAPLSGPQAEPVPGVVRGAHGAYEAAVIADKPVAYYRLAEKTGTTAYDSSGNGHNGTYDADVALGQPSLLKVDKGATSVSFPQGYVTEQATWSAQAVTAECWVRPTAADLQGSPRIIDNAWTDHDGNGFMLWLTKHTAGFNTGWLGDVGTFAFAPGRVYYVAGTFDQAGGATLYVNGLARANAPTGENNVNPQQGDGTTTYVGTLEAGNGPTDYFQGDIADCAVYDHALTADRIALHYNIGARAHVVPRGVPSPPPTPSPPPPTPLPSPIAYDAKTACIGGRVYANDVLPSGEGEFATNGLDRTWWGRERGNPLGGNQYSGFQTSWGRNQYDTYFGDSSDGLPGGHDPFYVGKDKGAPGAPQGVRIEAIKMPSDLVGNPAVNGANWYSGVLDTPVDQRFGFFVARVRLPAPNPGMSPAWWLLTNNGVPQGPHGPLAGEWDVQEMFGKLLGNGMNAGTILWNSGGQHDQNWGGTYSWPSNESTTPSQSYHDYGALIASGGAKISKNDYGPGGPGDVYGPSGTGITNYLDGVPLYGHTGGGNVTSGVDWKELMLMFQVGPSGGWLGTPEPANFPAYYWIQWVRVYERTSAQC
jgi:hypothetical protein